MSCRFRTVGLITTMTHSNPARRRTRTIVGVLLAVVFPAAVAFSAEPPNPLSRLNRSPLGGPQHYQRTQPPLAKEPCLKAGLAWIAAQQKPDGSFQAERASSDAFTVAVTSLAGLALFTDAGFRPQADKAVEFILRCARLDGYIYSGAPTFKGMWEHGYAAQLLGEALLAGVREKRETLRVKEAFKRAAAFILAAQNLEGGWGYRPLPDPHTEVGPGAAQLDVLLLARRAGLTVPDDAIRKGLESQVVLMAPPGERTLQGEWRSFSYEANAFVLASLLAWQKRPPVKAYLDDVEAVTPAGYFARYTEKPPFPGVYWSSGYHTLGLYYTALAFRRAGEAYRERFAKWHDDVAVGLAKIQNDQGAWKGWFGDVYASAFACLTLAAEKGSLALFQPDAPPSHEKASAAPRKTIPFQLKQGSELALSYSIAPAATLHRWQGHAATVKHVGLKEGRRAWGADALTDWFPANEIPLEGLWTIKPESASRFFSVFHAAARGTIELEVAGRKGNVVDVIVRSLVKFGKEADSHILTTAMTGLLELDVSRGAILAFRLETQSGCIRCKTAAGQYVSLNDTALKIMKAD
jgi:hypothetical protein